VYNTQTACVAAKYSAWVTSFVIYTFRPEHLQRLNRDREVD